MAFISEKEIENIRTNTNIVDIISGYIPLTLKGKNYFGVCPFHDDHSPSMSVSTSKQIFKCFSCGAVGNVFTFVKDIENVSFLEAVKIVAEKTGINVNFDIKNDSKILRNKEELEIMDLATKFFQNNLNTDKGEVAKKYLNDRGLNSDAIKDFNIGLALKDNDTLYKLLVKKGYSIKTITDLGLINKNGADVYDLFINRIIFPIHNLEGQAIGFTGRIYNNEKNLSKYYNSKESIIFKKGDILFNYHRAKDAIRTSKKVIVVEGNMDAIRVYSNGIKNVVALMGTAITNEQIAILKKLRSEVVLMLDNDSAGELATYNAGRLLENANIPVTVVRLSGAKDPDEYVIENGIDALEDNIKHRINFLEFKLLYLKQNKNLDNTEDLVKYIKDVLESIKDIKDDLTKQVTLRKISDEYKVSLETLENELNNITSSKIVKAETQEEKPRVKVKNKYDQAANNILYYMMNDGSYIKSFLKQLGYFETKLYRGISNVIIYYYEKNKNISLAEFISYISNNNELHDEIMEIINNNSDMELSDDFFMENINALKRIGIEEEIKKVKKELKEELDINKKVKLAMRLAELKKEV